mmetsp:Transcript_21387/g.46443  ORF Transcript_21387/g.46443 Transcript_21387/m.46443 type:complete len:86 (+) Transcript_21387:502-759(+)
MLPSTTPQPSSPVHKATHLETLFKGAEWPTTPPPPPAPSSSGDRKQQQQQYRQEESNKKYCDAINDEVDEGDRQRRQRQRLSSLD